jgi:hypothetical protein
VFIYTFIDYWDKVYILTNKRVIEINRKFIFFNEKHFSIEYGQIHEIAVNVGNPIYLALNVGKVIVQMPGVYPDITMDAVKNPFAIQDMIFTLHEHQEKKQ